MKFRDRRRPWLVRGAVLPLLALVAGCGQDPVLTPQTLPPRVPATIPAYDVTAEIPAGTAALALIPADASVITITDFDQVRAALGVPNLTSASPAADRSDFWERARRESVLLTPGMLVAESPRLMLEVGFTQDDVDWEAHFTTPSGSGWIVSFRPDLDMRLVRRAVDEDLTALTGGVVDTAQHLVSAGAVAPGGADEDTWGTMEDITELTSGATAESTYYSAGCVPLTEALGPEAGASEKEAVVDAHDPTRLAPLSRFSLSFADGLATARLGVGRPDLFRRADLASDFPTVGPTGFADAFAGALVDPSTGRIGYTVVAPVPAATATLARLLPFAVCNETEPS